MAVIECGMEPELSSETYWMLLSLLCLPSTSDQASRFTREIPTKSENDVRLACNPLVQLANTFGEYYSGWFDAFGPDCGVAETFQNLITELGNRDWNNPPGMFCKEEFFEGDGWKVLRRLAADALSEAGLPYWPVPRKIDFNEYIEFGPCEGDESD